MVWPALEVLLDREALQRCLVFRSQGLKTQPNLGLGFRVSGFRAPTPHPGLQIVATLRPTTRKELEALGIPSPEPEIPNP